MQKWHILGLREALPILLEEKRAHTLVMCLAQVRTGGPKDEEADYELPIWAGVLPLSTAVTSEPIADSRLPAGVEIPAHITEYRRGQRSSKS